MQHHTNTDDRRVRLDAGRPRARRRSLLLPATAALSLTAVLSGCGQDAGPRVIEGHRVASTPSRPVMNLSSADRFGFQRPGAGAPKAPGGGATAQPALAYDLPEGWEALAPSSMRLVNLRPAKHPDAEAYVTVLPGAGGGALANVNRWRNQMKQPPLESLDGLPRRPLLGGEAVVVDVEGEFAGMSGGAGKSGFRLLGALLTVPQGTLFVKMTGPAEVIGAEAQRFFAFLDSLRLASGPAGPAGHDGHDDHAGHDHGPGEHDDHAGHDHGPGEHPTTDDHAGHDHGPGEHPGAQDQGPTAQGGSQDTRPVAPPKPDGPTTGPVGPPPPVAPPADVPTITWQAPEGWSQGPEKPMRVVTLKPAGAPASECYVSVLRGPAGGEAANLDRWSQQMGQPALTEAARAALPKIEVLGEQVALFSVDGVFVGMGTEPQEGYRMLGLVVPQEAHTVFVKMIGPKAEVAAEEARFRAFCASLELKP